jgi:hypothetical protein
VSLVVIGVMIFLNLFLAILLENFDVPKNEDNEEGMIDSIKSFIIRQMLRAKRFIIKKYRRYQKKRVVIQMGEDEPISPKKGVLKGSLQIKKYPSDIKVDPLNEAEGVLRIKPSLKESISVPIFIEEEDNGIFKDVKMQRRVSNLEIINESDNE